MTDKEDVNVVINIAFILKVHIRQYLASSNIKLIPQLLKYPFNIVYIDFR